MNEPQCPRCAVPLVSGRIDAPGQPPALPKGSQWTGPPGRPAEVRALACPRCGLLQSYVSPDAVAPSWAETGQPSILQNPQVQLAVIVVGAIALVFVVWAVFFTSPSR